MYCVLASEKTDWLCCLPITDMQWWLNLCFLPPSVLLVGATPWMTQPAKVEVFWWKEKKTALRLAFDSSVLQREKDLGKWRFTVLYIRCVFNLFHMGILCMCSTLKGTVEQFIAMLCMRTWMISMWCACIYKNQQASAGCCIMNYL